MEPSDSIAMIETNLRSLVRSVMAAKYGSAWLDAKMPQDLVLKLEQRRSEEASRRAPAVVPNSLLEYTHLYELRKVIEGKWENFAPALGKKSEFVVLMDFVEDYRNAPAHSRRLLPHERDHLAGIAGIIRTAVTIFRSSEGPDMEYYPRIESVRDAFGNEITQPSTGVLTTDVDLHVGDEVTFECAGWDPQGRVLRWTTILNQGDSTIEPAEGSNVVLIWRVDESHVAERVFVNVRLTSDGKYHRVGEYDDMVTFAYQVVPPPA